jgi:NADH dehydrogenase
MQCISVGRRQGVVAFVDRDDRASGRLLTGRTGALVKELVCRFGMGSIWLERRFAGLYAWLHRALLERTDRSERGIVAVAVHDLEIVTQSRGSDQVING